MSAILAPARRVRGAAAPGPHGPRRQDTRHAGVSRVAGLPHAAECNKAPFMYEMKGALFGYAAPARPVADRLVPVPPVSRLRRTSLAAFPAAPTRLGRIPGCLFPDRPVPSLTVSGSPGFPGSPFPDPLVSQAHRFQISWFQPHRFRIARFPRLTVSGSAGFPASPVRAVRLPVRPGATRRPPMPSTRAKYRFPGLSRAPG
jgi:hypothetical protein